MVVWFWGLKIVLIGLAIARRSNIDIYEGLSYMAIARAIRISTYPKYPERNLYRYSRFLDNGGPGSMANGPIEDNKRQCTDPLPRLTISLKVAHSSSSRVRDDCILIKRII